MGHGEKIRLPFFGAYLSQLRKKAGIKTQSQVMKNVKKRIEEGIYLKEDFRELSYNNINADEKGLVSNLPTERLKAYAELYKVPYEEILSELIKEKYGVKMIPEDPERPVSIKNVVPQENAPFLEELNRLLSGEEREKVVACFNMLLTAFGGPNSTGRGARQVGAETENVKNKGAA